MISNKKFILLIIILLFVYHNFLHNSIEKQFSKAYFDCKNIRRPLKVCKKEINCSNLNCIGMPSGHAEAGSLLSCLLYFYNFIPLWVCLIIIVLISLQRIVTNMHALNQVIVGSLLGLIYATIYNYFTPFNISNADFYIVKNI